VSPRFSILLPVRDRADDVGRATVSVLAQTFSDLEVVVADGGSTDRTIDAVRTVADRRVRIVSTADDHDFGAGLSACRGEWVSVIDAGTTARPQWLARCAMLADRTGADVVFCGGAQHHGDGTLSEVLPAPRNSRPGAFVARADQLREVEADAPIDLTHWVESTTFTSSEHPSGGPLPTDPEGSPARSARTPEALVDWFDRPRDPAPADDGQRLRWALDAVDMLSDSPIPDVDLLARYATIGGVAAARLRRHPEAKALLGLARQLRRGELRPFARWAVASVPALSDRVWDPERN